MKAGSTGSNPGGGAAKLPVSAALTHLLDDIGKASFYLNTIVVGLDAVERGHEKPEALDIKWEPTDPISAARMARHFAVEAFMVRASEALSAFIKAYSALPRFAPITGKWTKDTGLAEKVDDIASALLGGKNYLVAGAVVLVHWRNRIVHNGSFSLQPKHTATLTLDAQKIHDAYRNLDIAMLLDHARVGRPTLKDVSCLIAMTINLARRMDELVYTSFGKDDVVAWIFHFGLEPAIKKVIRETSRERVADSIRRVLKSNAPRLETDFSRFCEPDGSDLIKEM
ncbi:hypothetical protein [Agrobacterium deltaense]|uniref:hypothetical protein n=1 Tax=Agrobacterium deltaense TaxID=1183412 RepID=UPI0013C4438D|nr:hypothetical protein [Agrobacterium deltaense]